MTEFKAVCKKSENERQQGKNFAHSIRRTPIPDEELLANVGLYLNRQSLARVLHIHEIYKLILPVPGVIMEFGVRWGQNQVLLHALRGIYEPFNYSRKVIGFDTFKGFPAVHPKDGSKVSQGDYSVDENYENTLEAILNYNEEISPIPHIKKYELIKGDVNKTLDKYFEEHPETVIAMAYFDLDLYKPTKECLEKIQSRLTKGSVVAFDELNHPDLPGESQALKEVWGFSRYPLKRTPFSTFGAYAVIE